MTRITDFAEKLNKDKRIYIADVLRAAVNIAPSKDYWCRGERSKRLTEDEQADLGVEHQFQHCALGMLDYVDDGLCTEAFTALAKSMLDGLTTDAFPLHDTFNWYTLDRETAERRSYGRTTAISIIATVNNTSEYEDVRRAFDRAIQALEEERCLST